MKRVWKITTKNRVLIFDSSSFDINTAFWTDLLFGIVSVHTNWSYDQLEGYVRETPIEFWPNDGWLIGTDVESLDIIEGINTNDVVAILKQTAGRIHPTETVFYLSDKDFFVVKFANTKEISREKLASGQYLLPTLAKSCGNGDFNVFHEIMHRYISKVFDEFKVMNTDNLLQGEAIDCLPKNTVISGDDFVFFDKEFVHIKSIDKTHFLLRLALHMPTIIIHTKNWPFDSPAKFYYELCKNFDIPPNPEEDLKNEIAFLATVLEPNAILLKKEFLSSLFYGRKWLRRIYLLLNYLNVSGKK